jgi:positive regulator of sigma E activity
VEVFVVFSRQKGHSADGLNFETKSSRGFLNHVEESETDVTMSTRIFVILAALFVIVYLFGEASGNKRLAIFLMLALVAVGFIYLIIKARPQKFTQSDKRPTEKKRGFLSWFK